MESDIVQNEEEIKTEAPKRTKYKSSKGADDKRRQVCLLNLAKARQIRQANKKKEVEEYEIESDSYESSQTDSTESEDELIITKKKKKTVNKKSEPKPDLDRLSRLEIAIANLAKEKKKKRRVIEKRTVIQIPQQQQQQQLQQSYNPYKQNLLKLC